MKTSKEKKQKIFSVLIVFFLFSQLSGQTELPKSKHYKLEKIAEGVYAAIHNDNGGYAICNAGIIDMGDKTIVTDPFISPSAARDLKEHAEILTGRPVSLVLNLDQHIDHTRGNQVFFPDADIIGTANARRFIIETFQSRVDQDKVTAPTEIEKITKQLELATDDEKPELMMWYGYHMAKIESFKELRMVPPNITITDTLVIYGSDRNLIVIPTGIGHTPGDMIAYLPEESIIFMGDLLFINRHPSWGHGDPESWKNTLEEILKLKPEIVIPGHGPIGNSNSFYPLIDYIETLTSLVDIEVKKGKNEIEILEIPMPDKYKDWWFGSFYKRNIEFLYHRFTSASN